MHYLQILSFEEVLANVYCDQYYDTFFRTLRFTRFTQRYSSHISIQIFFASRGTFKCILTISQFQAFFTGKLRSALRFAGLRAINCAWRSVFPLIEDWRGDRRLGCSYIVPGMTRSLSRTGGALNRLVHQSTNSHCGSTHCGKLYLWPRQSTPTPGAPGFLGTWVGLTTYGIGIS
jgi:hypothetical protein